MKSLLTIAIVIASSTAFATRSRLNALGNAAHLVDQSTVYANPSHIVGLGESLTLETGATTTSTADANAEGLLIKSFGNAKLGLSLGHKDVNILAIRTNGATAVSTTATTATQQNPLELTYGTKMGDMSVAGTLVYSNYNDKKNSVKENVVSLRAGAQTALWTASVDLGLVNKWEDTSANNDEIKGKTNIIVNGGYNVSPELYAFGVVEMKGYTAKNAGADARDVSETNIEVGAVDSMKKDGNEFFYGASLRSESSKDAKQSDKKVTALKVPVIVGFEADAASWLTLRASVKQTVLVNDSKEENSTSTTSEYSPGTNNTTFAAGAGLKFNKVTVDGTILAGGSQNLNTGSNNLLGQVGLTYAF